MRTVLGNFFQLVLSWARMSSELKLYAIHSQPENGRYNPRLEPRLLSMTSSFLNMSYLFTDYIDIQWNTYKGENLRDFQRCFLSSLSQKKVLQPTGKMDRLWHPHRPPIILKSLYISQTSLRIAERISGKRQIWASYGSMRPASLISSSHVLNQNFCGFRLIRRDFGMLNSLPCDKAPQRK